MQPNTTDSITIGPRVRLQIFLRINELQCRHKPTLRDLREIAQLEEFLRSVSPRAGHEEQPR
jgi:hypothetical protein